MGYMSDKQQEIASQWYALEGDIDATAKACGVSVADAAEGVRMELDARMADMPKTHGDQCAATCPFLRQANGPVFVCDRDSKGALAWAEHGYFTARCTEVSE